jgi:hypothetical protein
MIGRNYAEYKIDRKEIRNSIKKGKIAIIGIDKNFDKKTTS